MIKKIQVFSKSWMQTGFKEWNNWTKFSDGKWITREDFMKMKETDSTLKIIPTRWVEVDKAEPGEESVLKSRLVVRGDLEDASKMRTDSPKGFSIDAITRFHAGSLPRHTALWRRYLSSISSRVKT